MTRSSVLVVIPTYNELTNIELLITRIINSFRSLDFLFIDDSSPDGTALLIEKAKQENPRINLIVRPEKLGVASAFIQGLNFALENSYNWVACMDADHSHRLEDLDEMLSHLYIDSRNIDLLIGSRYVSGGKVLEIPWGRQLMSKLGNAFSRFCLGTNIRDTTGGFRVYRVDALRGINLSDLSTHGYGFQLQLLRRFQVLKLEIFEFPIEFNPRFSGKSKLRMKIVVEVFVVCLVIYFKRKLTILKR